MKTHLFRALFALIFAGALLFSCQKEESNLPYKADLEQLNLPSTPDNYVDINIPSHLAGFSMSQMGVTNEGATLGRVLFYDKKLSLNNSTACASCHLQEKAFSDDLALSPGFDGRSTTRNSMAIINVGMESHFFWDLRVTDLEDMVLKPIKNHIEMGLEDMDDLVDKLAKVDYYPALFEQAYGDQEVTKDRIASGLAQFLRSMVSTRSKYDVGLVNNFSNFSSKEMDGFWLFNGEGQCYRCHDGANFKESFDFTWNDLINVANIGLDDDYSDKGMGEFEEERDGEFKVPSLRNVSLTAPYMHDGRFQTLMDVVEHYNSGIKNHPNLDQRLKGFSNNAQPIQLNLSQEKKEALVAFLETLTDFELTKDPRFSTPFQE